MALTPQFLGSFQRGKHFRSSDPLKAAWREVEKLGTVEHLSSIAEGEGRDQELARLASLKVRQALELWKASREASILTRPLLLYYSILNLTRGIMLPWKGSFGEHSHGLSFKSASTLLDCTATVSKRGGTFRRFAELLGVTSELLDNRSYTLRDLLAVIPEIYEDFPLLRRGESSVVPVYVRALMNGQLKLEFHIPGMDEKVFAAEWQMLFPWWKEHCVIESARTLQLRENPKNEAEISELCHTWLIYDLRFRRDAYWFDHRVGDNVALLPRQLAYVAAVYILSNVARYEPEFLEQPMSNLNNFGFVLGSFLDNAERFFPQLIVELLYGMPVFFE